MPNWVMNQLTIEDADKANEIFNYMSTDENLFDFNQIIPMPVHIDNNETIPFTDVLDQETDNWYNWSIKNWGTKWNASYPTFKNDNTITFQTAWSAVPNLIFTLMERFDNPDYNYIAADEDEGYGCIMMICENGEVDMIELPNESEEAYTVYHALWGYDYDD